MRETIGDLWTFHDEGKWIVITTNIGWKSDGTNPMGAGIAKQAAARFGGLPLWYGTKCKRFGAATAVQIYKPGKLILFPTKALDPSRPWLSWKADSDIKLITRSVKQLAKLIEVVDIDGDIGIPMVGCQNGNLSSEDVLPILRNYLDDRFVLVHYT